MIIQHFSCFFLEQMSILELSICCFTSLVDFVSLLSLLVSLFSIVIILSFTTSYTIYIKILNIVIIRIFLFLLSCSICMRKFYNKSNQPCQLLLLKKPSDT